MLLLLLALYGQSLSIAQSRQRVASPAFIGLALWLKCRREPNEDTLIGGVGPIQWQMISMSLQKSVKNEISMSPNQGKKA